MITIYLGLKLLLDSSDSPHFAKAMRGTILHRSKYLAPTPEGVGVPYFYVGTVSAGLNRIVSVRNYILLYKGVTLYSSKLSWSVFGLSPPTPFEKRCGGSYPTPTFIL